jgi:hypothetical protein
LSRKERGKKTSKVKVGRSALRGFPRFPPFYLKKKKKKKNVGQDSE